MQSGLDVVALVVSLIAAFGVIATYVRQPSFMSRGRAEEILERNKELRQDRDRFEGQIKSKDALLEASRAEADFLRNQVDHYRRLWEKSQEQLNGAPERTLLLTNENAALRTKVRGYELKLRALGALGDED